MALDMNYKHKVLLAAYELSREYPLQKGYEFRVSVNGDLLLMPWNEVPGRGKIYSRFLRIEENRIFGSDETEISELEDKVREIEKQP